MVSRKKFVISESRPVLFFCFLKLGEWIFFFLSPKLLFCLYICFCQLHRRGEILEVLYLNLHPVNITLSHAAAVALKVYIYPVFFFAIALQRKKLQGIISGLFFEAKNPPASWGDFAKENKCYFLKFWKIKKPPTSWGGVPLSWGGNNTDWFPSRFFCTKKPPQQVLEK